MPKDFFKIFSINRQKHPNFHYLPPLRMSKLSKDNANMHQKFIHPHFYPLKNYKVAKNS